MPGMTTRRDRRADAARVTAFIRTTIGAEIRDTRIGAGVSQLAAGRSVGMSHAQFGRIERATLPNVTVGQLASACSAVGLKLVVRAYPDGEAIRDAAQLALLARFRAGLPDGFRIRFEVPLPILSDRRAWDAVVSPPADGEFAVEAESRLHDIQAMDRRIALKQRDGGWRVSFSW
jgi:transcriptional regulator with XRE-family HTH domain